MSTTTALGTQAELLIAQHLKQQGFTILAHNYTQRCGEIDLIAQKKELLVFVEVKCRRSNYFDMAEVVTRSKQKKIIRTAQYFLCATKREESVCQFDVALVTYTPDNKSEITYIPHAFTAQD